MFWILSAYLLTNRNCYSIDRSLTNFNYTKFVSVVVVYVCFIRGIFSFSIIKNVYVLDVELTFLHYKLIVNPDRL